MQNQQSVANWEIQYPIWRQTLITTAWIPQEKPLAYDV